MHGRRRTSSKQKNGNAGRNDRLIFRRDWNFVAVKFGGHGSVMVRRDCHLREKGGHAALRKVPVPSDNKSQLRRNHALIFTPTAPTRKRGTSYAYVSVTKFLGKSQRGKPERTGRYLCWT